MEATHTFEHFFEHKTLTKIFGEPDAKSLQQLFKQLKRNAQSVPSTLGGGQYGHLFMVSTDEEWQNLPGTTPVLAPADPGDFTLDGRPSAAEIAVREKTHEKEKKKYEKYQALKRILRAQLVAAIEPAYLDPIRCDITDMINLNITEIMEFLQTTYGKLTVNQKEEEIANIKNLSYDPSTSINVLLTAVQEHADLLKIAGTPLQDHQIQDLAYYLLNKYHIFKEALVNWNKLPQPKTWNDMKLHMRDEYQQLKNVNALSVKESIVNTTDIVKELQMQQEDLLQSAEKRFKNGMTEVMNMAILDLDNKEKEKQEFVNSAAEISALKMEIQKLHSQLQNNHNSNQNTYNTNRFNQSSNSQFNSRGYRPQNNRQPRRNNGFTRQFYCWTHGAGHSGWNCMNPAEGHQPEATFKNRMGGNNYGCYNTRPRRFNNKGRA